MHPEGFEPSTPNLKGSYSSQLSYRCSSPSTIQTWATRLKLLCTNHYTKGEYLSLQHSYGITQWAVTYNWGFTSLLGRFRVSGDRKAYYKPFFRKKMASSGFISTSKCVPQLHPRYQASSLLLICNRINRY